MGGSPRREKFLVWGGIFNSMGGVKNFKKIVFPPLTVWHTGVQNSVCNLGFQYHFSRRYEICFCLYGMQIILIFIGQWMMTSHIFDATWQHC